MQRWQEVQSISKDKINYYLYYLVKFLKIKHYLEEEYLHKTQVYQIIQK